MLQGKQTMDSDSDLGTDASFDIGELDHPYEWLIDKNSDQSWSDDEENESVNSDSDNKLMQYL